MSYNFSPQFAKSIKITNSKTFGIRRDFAIAFVVTFLCASKLLMILKIYKLFLIFTFTISFITFMVMLIFPSTYKILTNIYYDDTKNIIIPLKIDQLHMLSGKSVGTGKNNDSIMQNFRLQLFTIYDKITSRDFYKLSIIFLLIFLAYLLMFYIIITMFRFVDIVINNIITSAIWEYKFW